MTFSELQSYFEWRGQALMAGRYADLARQCDVPYRVHRQGDALSLTRTDLVERFLKDLHDGLSDRGISRLHPEVFAMGLPGEERPVWVRYRTTLEDGTVGPRGQSRFVLTGSAWLVQTVNHQKPLIPNQLRLSRRLRPAQPVQGRS